MKSQVSKERGYINISFLNNQKIVKMMQDLMSSKGLTDKKIQKIITGLDQDVSYIFEARKFLNKHRYNKNELEEIKHHAKKLKALFLNKSFDPNFLKVEKSLAGRLTNEKWLNVLDEILTAVEKENRTAKIHSIVHESIMPVRIVANFLTKIDRKLKPSTYYNEELDRLGFGAEIIYLYISFYDKRVKRRTIKDALILVKSTKK
jgi:trans-aconitate methyltransferase